MKKFFLYASVIGVTIGIAYWIYKKSENNKEEKDLTDNIGTDTEKKPEEDLQNSNIHEEIYKTKEERAQKIHERHFEAGEMMKDAYKNIMDDFVEDFSDERIKNVKEVVDSESVTVEKDLDSISSEIDDLLK